MYRIATWNLDRPALRRRRSHPAQLQRIAEIDARLWVLTETDRRIRLPGLASRATSRPMLATYGDDEAYAAIHYDAGLKPRTWDTFDPRFALCLVFDESPIGPLVVYGSIITYHGDKYEGAANWQRHEQSVRHHGVDWRKLAAEFPRYTLVVAGDFNQHLDGGSYTTKRSDLELRAALDDADLKCVTDRDFSAELGGRHNLDHIAISRAALSRWTVEASVWTQRLPSGQALSDHNATSVDVKVAT